MRQRIRQITLLLWVAAGFLILKTHTVNELQYWLLWTNTILMLVEECISKEEKENKEMGLIETVYNNMTIEEILETSEARGTEFVINDGKVVDVIKG